MPLGEGRRPGEFPMIDLILASLFFPLSHFLISSTPLRAMLVNLLGERRYSLSYSLLAVAALFWLAGLFSIALMITLGHVAGLLTFGSIGFVGIAGASILDAKKARQQGRAWDAFADATSNIPFLAIIQGRQ